MREGRPGSVGRVIDANANRAREGLRVAEDYARFIAGDAELARSIREVRHEVTRCVDLVGSRALLAERDVEGDGGASPEGFEQALRADLRGIVTSAFKRAEEALRSLEELEKRTLLAVPPGSLRPAPPVPDNPPGGDSGP